MPSVNDLDKAFYEGQRDPDFMPFVVNDSVELKGGPYAGVHGAVISAFFGNSELSYTIELSSGQDIQASPSNLQLIKN